MTRSLSGGHARMGEDGPMRIATANVNGIRAAERRGMPAWLAERQPDILCLQEVRADDPTLYKIMGELARRARGVLLGQGAGRIVQ